METIDLHGLGLNEAKMQLEKVIENAIADQLRAIRIIHGQGKHSEFFPVIKSFVRQWLRESLFAAENVEAVYRGEDGSPYTSTKCGGNNYCFKR